MPTYADKTEETQLGELPQSILESQKVKKRGGYFITPQIHIQILPALSFFLFLPV
jgi:hypothetical protein